MAAPRSFDVEAAVGRAMGVFWSHAGKVPVCRRGGCSGHTKLGSEVLIFTLKTDPCPSFRALRRRRHQDNRQGADVAMDAQCRNHANSIVLTLAVPKPEF